MPPAPPSRRVAIPSRRGHRLAGREVRPAGDGVPPWVLLSHCFTCGKDLKGYYHLCRALAGAGWASLRFDFTGLGESGGEFAATDLDTAVADLLDAAGGMAADATPPRLLMGHSLGGVAALLAAPQLPTLRGVVLLGTPSDPTRVSADVPAVAAAAASGAPVTAQIGGRRVAVGPGLLPSLQRADLAAAVRRLRVPLLILHAPGDQVVPFAQARRISGWAGTGATLVPLDGADHLLSTAASAARAARAVAEWSRLLPPPA